ncbi:MAG: NUDIX hydrolase [Dissulfurispiraceae bacterium]|jgi:8-oxo-dGTP diphosphatase|nr:NUDIX hydrolase [Dissulfurispiraceae bacterium]
MSDKPAAIRQLYSAGGIVFRKLADSTEFALISIKNNSIWTIPKGIIDRDETTEQAAMREIEEETGLRSRIIEKLGQKSYWFFLKDENVKCRKTVTYYLLEYIDGSINSHCCEVDDARWFGTDEALDAVSYKSDRDIIKSAINRL